MRIDLDEVCSLPPASLGENSPLREIGRSREGRPLPGATLGDGPLRISLIAGAHADEPVGPRTLERLITWLAAGTGTGDLLNEATFTICPGINPDGRERNSAWANDPSHPLESYLLHHARELPGDDIEFGFPRENGRPARPENIAVANLLRENGPFDFHASLHGMAFAEGAWYLLNRREPADTSGLREGLSSFTASLGMGLHDWDREGEKGFFRIAPGFCTTPTSTAMKQHFENLSEPREAEKFLPSSMEFVSSLGGAPLCMVSEIPLFLVAPTPAANPIRGAHFIDVMKRIPEACSSFEDGRQEELEAIKDDFGLTPVSELTAMKLQLAMIFLGSGLLKVEELG